MWTDNVPLEVKGYDARVPDLNYNSEYRDCFWYAPCDDKDSNYECNPVTKQDQRYFL